MDKIPGIAKAPKKEDFLRALFNIAMVDLKRLELSTSRMRTERSPTLFSSMPPFIGEIVMKTAQNHGKSELNPQV